MSGRRRRDRFGDALSEAVAPHRRDARARPESAKGWAPAFKDVIDHLESQGLVTKKMRPWVDRIKDVGNEANHELQPVSAEDALDVATFTQQLLTLAFEMDALMADPEAAVEGK